MAVRQSMQNLATRGILTVHCGQGGKGGGGELPETAREAGGVLHARHWPAGQAG